MSEAMNAQVSQYQKIVEKCWADEAFKKQLMADPAGTLAREGWTLPEGISVEVVEETDQVKYLLIPARQDTLDDASLEAVSGGALGVAINNRSDVFIGGSSSSSVFSNTPSNSGAPGSLRMPGT